MVTVSAPLAAICSPAGTLTVFPKVKSSILPVWSICSFSCWTGTKSHYVKDPNAFSRARQSGRQWIYTENYIKFKISVLKESVKIRVHTLWFYLHQTLENANEYIVAENRVSGCLGMRQKPVREEEFPKDKKKLWEMMNIFIILIVVIVSLVYT